MKIKYSPFIFIALIVALGFLGNSFLRNETRNGKTASFTKPVKSVKELIAEKKATGKFEHVKLFDIKATDGKSQDLQNRVKSFVLLSLKKENISDLLNKQKENIIFEIPVSENKILSLELTKIPVLSDKFEVNLITEKGIVPFIYKPGVYYRGIVKGNSNSAVSVSIFENSVAGIISDETGNYNLGMLKGDKSEESYIFYNEKDLVKKNEFKCNVDDNGKMRIKNNYQGGNGNTDGINARQPVDVFFVADYQMYLDFSSNTSNVTNYITSVFNEVATIYQNEFLLVQISSVSVYTTPDPYRNIHNSFNILTLFGENTKDNFTGDLAHLLTTRDENFGGLSWVNSLCASYNSSQHSGRFSFSGIETNYNPFPTYSWTVYVISHEMGHSFGSQHTHSCAWPITQNTIGQIDYCVHVNGESCNGTPTMQNSNGTIMSYCHLNGAINLYLGFGPMPGDTIRLRYNQCDRFGPVINSSELPTNFQLDQNFPNPFNPATTISFAVPQDAYITIRVYDITGRETAELINNKFYSRGYQNILFNSSQYNLPSGVYFYKLIASGSGSGNIFMQVRKMVLLK